MSEETSDALTGHYEGKVSRDYGEYYVDSVLRPAIQSMVSPFDIEAVDAITEMPKEPQKAGEASVRS